MASRHLSCENMSQDLMKIWRASIKLLKLFSPSGKNFYSKLIIKSCIKWGYKKSNKTWNTFYIKNLEEYHDLQEQSDPLLLTSLFEKIFEKFVVEKIKLIL